MNRGVFRCLHKLRTMPRSPRLPAQTRPMTQATIFGCSTNSQVGSIGASNNNVQTSDKDSKGCYATDNFRNHYGEDACVDYTVG
jgi:hypothetical protein